ncbi:MAG: hypothetical protein IAI48_06085 [Candidatus Eremiobacteraeota bacterium]|nr:hypothetical protein [Candidatus Eremiobacteraeota bacterium]
MLIHSVFESESTCTAAERKSARRYQIELLASMALYVVTLFVSIRNVDHVAAGPGKVALALLPVFGIVATSLALVRYVLRQDEMQRRTFVDAAAIAAIVTAVATMTLGFLENAGVPRISMTWVWPFTMISFAVSLPFVRRRYR